MAQSQRLEFKRFERDCPANEARKLDGSQLIYDWYVIIDGELRALWSRNVSGVGYQLYDPDHRPICTPKDRADIWARERPIKVKSKALFDGATSTALSDGVIPTLADLEWLRAYDAATVINKRLDEEAEDRAERIRSVAPALFKAAKEMQKFFGSPTEPSEQWRANLCALVDAALMAAGDEETMQTFRERLSCR